MQEILFRGKDADNGNWVYGFYIAHLPYTPSVFESNAEKAKERYENDTKHFIARDGFSDWNMPRSLEAMDVKKETVGQFTGLLDKNGARIFEGDVLRSEYNGVDMVVKFGSYPSYCPADKQDCQATGFYAESIDNKDCPLMPIGDPSEYGTVVGNIHDNPELLEGAKQ